MEAIERLRRKRGPLSNAEIIDTFLAADFGTRIVVESATEVAPPVSPVIGSMYLVPTGASGIWAGHEHTIAVRYEEGWTYIPPRDGVIAIVRDTDSMYVANDGVWAQSAGATPAHGDLSGLDQDDHPQYLTETRGDARYPSISHNHDAQYDAIGEADAAVAAHVAATDPHTEYVKKVNDRLGVNATADTTNRLYVKSDAVMFSHDDVTPGTGDLLHKLNKSSAAKIAATLLLDNGANRARAGLINDDNYTIQVSADGTAWLTALTIDRATGAVSMPLTSGGGGAVKQIIASKLTTTFATTSSSDTATGLAATITPQSASNNVMVRVLASVGGDFWNAVPKFSIYRSIGGGAYTKVAPATAGVYVNHQYLSSDAPNSALITYTLALEFDDNPATTQAVTYQFRAASGSGTHNACVNRRNDGSPKGESHMTLMEHS